MKKNEHQNEVIRKMERVMRKTEERYFLYDYISGLYSFSLSILQLMLYMLHILVAGDLLDSALLI